MSEEKKPVSPQGLTTIATLDRFKTFDNKGSFPTPLSGPETGTTTPRPAPAKPAP